MFSLRLIAFPGMTEDQALNALASHFGIPLEKGPLLLGRLPTIVKKGIEKEKALQLADKFRQAGAHVAIEDEASGEVRDLQPKRTSPLPVQAQKSEQQKEEEVETVIPPDCCPNCSVKRQPQMDTCLSCGIIFKKWDAYFDKLAKAPKR